MRLLIYGGAGDARLRDMLYAIGPDEVIAASALGLEPAEVPEGPWVHLAGGWADYAAVGREQLHLLTALLQSDEPDAVLLFADAAGSYAPDLIARAHRLVRAVHVVPHAYV